MRGWEGIVPSVRLHVRLTVFFGLLWLYYRLGFIPVDQLPDGISGFFEDHNALQTALPFSK